MATIDDVIDSVTIAFNDANRRVASGIACAHQVNESGMATLLSFANRLSPEERIVALTDLIRVDPGHQPTYTSLGGTYMNLGRYDEAIEPLKRAYELKKDIHDFVWWKYAMYKAGQFEKLLEESNGGCTFNIAGVQVTVEGDTPQEFVRGDTDTRVALPPYSYVALLALARYKLGQIGYWGLKKAQRKIEQWRYSKKDVIANDIGQEWRNIIKKKEDNIWNNIMKCMLGILAPISVMSLGLVGYSTWRDYHPHAEKPAIVNKIVQHPDASGNYQPKESPTLQKKDAGTTPMDYFRDIDGTLYLLPPLPEKRPAENRYPQEPRKSVKKKAAPKRETVTGTGSPANEVVDIARERKYHLEESISLSFDEGKEVITSSSYEVYSVDESCLSRKYGTDKNKAVRKNLADTLRGFVAPLRRERTGLRQTINVDFIVHYTVDRHGKVTTQIIDYNVINDEVSDPPAVMRNLHVDSCPGEYSNTFYYVVKP